MADVVNPFAQDPDRGAIWTMLVEPDIVAFLAVDWSGFIAEGFRHRCRQNARS